MYLPHASRVLMPRNRCEYLEKIWSIRGSIRPKVVCVCSLAKRLENSSPLNVCHNSIHFLRYLCVCWAVCLVRVSR